MIGISFSNEIYDRTKREEEEENEEYVDIKNGKGVKGYAPNVEFKRIIYKSYIDIALEMSTLAFVILDQQLNQNIAYGDYFLYVKLENRWPSSKNEE